MKVKVSETTACQLNWLVSKCENHQSRCPWLLAKEGYKSWQSYEEAWGNPIPNYCEEWEKSGPIIEREELTISCNWQKPYAIKLMFETRNVIQQSGSTPLIAAMRCYVASKLGDEIEIPDELIN